ncbi:MAG: AtpZ/AtpI family protein [bacterium]
MVGGGKEFRNFLITSATYSHLGLTLAGAIILFFFLGYWLDGRLGTKPVLSIVGAFLGATGGFVNLVRTLNRIQKHKEGEGENQRS